MFRPTASPEIMPIELVFSKWRFLVSKEDLPNLDTLVYKVAFASKSITKSDINNCINHCVKLLRKCLKREPLF